MDQDRDTCIDDCIGNGNVAVNEYPENKISCPEYKMV